MKKDLSYIQTINKYKLKINFESEDDDDDGDAPQATVSVFSTKLGGSWSYGNTIYEAINNWKKENLGVI